MILRTTFKDDTLQKELIISELVQKKVQQQHPVPIVFKQKQHQTQYESDGFILMDFLSDAEIVYVLEQFEAKTKWSNEGFFRSILTSIEGYNKWANTLLEPFGKRFIEQYMINYEVIASSFMVKGKGKDSFIHAHQDTTFVDETKYASFNIWIPLVDVNYKNGAISIMKGGHRIPFSIRGSNTPDTLQNQSDFTPDKLTYVPMKAGQALVYDHRCIHVSPANKSGKTRPVMTIGIVPQNTPIFHYYYDKNGALLQKYKVDESFLYNQFLNPSKKPQNALLIDEQETTDFPSFTGESLKSFFALQIPRKKSLFEIFNFLTI